MIGAIASHYVDAGGGVTFVNSASVPGAAGSSRSITVPTGVQIGDMLLALSSGDAGSAFTFSTPAGWTALRTWGDPGNWRNGAHLMWKVATASEVAGQTVTFTTSASLNRFRVQLLAYRGVLTSEAPAAAFSETGASPATSPSIATTVNGTTVVSLYLVVNRDATTPTLTEPTAAGLTSRMYVTEAAGAMRWQDETLATAGTKPARNSTATNTYTVGGAAVALKPA